jgi:hypothetical protein
MKRALDSDLARFCAILAQPGVSADVVPPGWFNAREISKSANRERCTISKRMVDMVASGKAETTKFRINTARGIYPVPHYRLLK